MKKLLVLCLLLMACTPETRKDLAPTDSERADRVSYFKDHRTNLCFAATYVSSYPIGQDMILTNVPCTPEVEKLLTTK